MPRMTIKLTEEEIKTAVEAYLRERTDYDDWEVTIACQRRPSGDMREQFDVWYATAEGSRDV